MSPNYRASFYRWADPYLQKNPGDYLGAVNNFETNLFNNASGHAQGKYGNAKAYAQNIMGADYDQFVSDFTAPYYAKLEADRLAQETAAQVSAIEAETAKQAEQAKAVTTNRAGIVGAAPDAPTPTDGTSAVGDNVNVPVRLTEAGDSRRKYREGRVQIGGTQGGAAIRL